MGKMILKLHQAKKWEKIPFVSDDEILEYEKYIYNDLDLKEHLDKKDQRYNTDWMVDILKEEESIISLPSPVDNYVLTSLGRLFNVDSKKQIKVNLSGNLFTMNLKGININIKKYFVNNGLIYSGSLIKQNYDNYGWGYCEIISKYIKKK